MRVVAEFQHDQAAIWWGLRKRKPRAQMGVALSANGGPGPGDPFYSAMTRVQYGVYERNSRWDVGQRLEETYPGDTNW
jgi:hypothetical protein